MYRFSIQYSIVVDGEKLPLTGLTVKLVKPGSNWASGTTIPEAAADTGYYESDVSTAGYYEIWDTQDSPSGSFSGKTVTVGLLDTTGIAANAVDTEQITDGAVTAGKIAATAVTAVKLAPGAIDVQVEEYFGTVMIQDGANRYDPAQYSENYAIGTTSSSGTFIGVGTSRITGHFPIVALKSYAIWMNKYPNEGAANPPAWRGYGYLHFYHYSEGVYLYLGSGANVNTWTNGEVPNCVLLTRAFKFKCPTYAIKHYSTGETLPVPLSVTHAALSLLDAGETANPQTSYYPSMSVFRANVMLESFDIYTEVVQGDFETYAAPVEYLTAERIATRGITNAKLDDAAVTNEKIADEAITSGKIAGQTIVADNIHPAAAIDRYMLGDSREIYLGDNLINPDDVQTTTYMNPATGVIGYHASWSISGYIDISGAKRIQLYVSYGVAFYTAGHVFISGTTNTIDNVEVVVPTGAVYVVANLLPSWYANNILFLKASSLTMNSYDWLRLRIDQYDSYFGSLRDEKVVVLGTSIAVGSNTFEPYIYHSMLSRALGYTLVNTALSGQRLPYGALPTSSGATSMTIAEHRAANPTAFPTNESVGLRSWENIFNQANADSALWVFDVNSNNSGYAGRGDLDTFNPDTWAYDDDEAFSTHRTTFAGAFIYLIDKLYQLNPVAKAVIVNFRGNGGDTIYGQVKELAALLRIKHIDLFGVMQLKGGYLNTVYYDGDDDTHPNSLGHQRIYKELLPDFSML